MNPSLLLVAAKLEFASVLLIASNPDFDRNGIQSRARPKL